HGGRVSAGLRPDTWNLNPVGPHLELLDPGSAKGVACREHDAATLAAPVVPELRDRRRLADAIHTDHQDDGEPLAQEGQAGGVRSEQLDEPLLERFVELVPRAELAPSESAPHLLEENVGRGRTDISSDEQLLQLIPNVLRDLGAPKEDGDAPEKAGPRLSDARLELRILLFPAKNSAK